MDEVDAEHTGRKTCPEAGHRFQQKGRSWNTDPHNRQGQHKHSDSFRSPASANFLMPCML